MPVEKYKHAWVEFKEKMSSLRKRRQEIFASISKKLDEQQLDSLKKKLNIHE